MTMGTKELFRIPPRAICLLCRRNDAPPDGGLLCGECRREADAARACGEPTRPKEG